MSYPHSSLLEAKSAQTLIQKKPFACNFHIQSEGIEGLIPFAGKMSGNGLNVACNEIMTWVKIVIIFLSNALKHTPAHTHPHTLAHVRTRSHYLKHPAAFFSPLGIKHFLPWQTKQCHQCYMTPLPLTCTIVRIMLSDHFNRLPGYRFSWVCRMRDEAGSWGGVLKNNTKMRHLLPAVKGIGR